MLVSRSFVEFVIKEYLSSCLFLNGNEEKHAHPLLDRGEKRAFPYLIACHAILSFLAKEMTN
ncbi:hypothetical protein C2W64_04706 [Brevibacillus laterosporus]|nr:hypothetical protein C2W64_04706 [Brevibacillus laterosporus]